MIRQLLASYSSIGSAALSGAYTVGSVAAMGLAWEPVAELLSLQARGGRDVALKVWALLALDGWRRTA